MLSKIAKVETQVISINELHEFPGNPNEESFITFNNLTAEINEDGFDQPLIIVPRSNFESNLSGYYVVSGNHRLRALRSLNFEKVDCVIHEWDSETCKIKVVRRNLLTGDLNSKKFTELVDSLSGYTEDQLADEMGFQNIEEFQKYYEKEVEQQQSCSDEHSGGSNGESFLDNFTVLLQRLIREYGDTVAYSFMFFMFGAKVHLTIQANATLKRKLETITKICETKQLDINKVLTGLLCVGVMHTAFDTEQADIQFVLDEAETEEEDYELHAVTQKIEVVDTGEDTEAADPFVLLNKEAATSVRKRLGIPNLDEK